MGIFSFLDPVLNFLFDPLLGLSYFWAILILSLLISLLITLIYKWTTDQNLMKQLKQETKELQKEMKQLKAHPEQMTKVQKKMMETNMKYMTKSFKPMLYTFLPIILIFGWMNAHLAYIPLAPGQEFIVTTVFTDSNLGNVSMTVPEGITLLSGATQTIAAKEASWAMKGDEGEYLLEVTYRGQSYTKNMQITTEKVYAPVQKRVRDGELRAIVIQNKPVKILNLFGWKLGWLGTYIIFSIISSMGFRRMLKVY